MTLRAAGLLLLAACGVERDQIEDDSVAALLAFDGWRVAEPSVDPHRGHRPERASCPAAGLAFEDRVLEVDTGTCTYATLVQEILHSAPSGRRIALRVWHQPLWSEEAAVAHVAFAIEETVLLDEWIPVPSPERGFWIDFEVSNGFVAGAPAFFHLHNHGANSWRLADVMIAKGANE